MPITRSGTTKREITRMDYPSVTSQPQENTSTAAEEQQATERQQQQQQDTGGGGGEEEGGVSSIEGMQSSGRGGRKGQECMQRKILLVKRAGAATFTFDNNYNNDTNQQEQVGEKLAEKVSWSQCCGMMVEQPCQNVQCLLFGSFTVVSGKMLDLAEEDHGNFFKLEYPDGDKQAARALGCEQSDRVRVNSIPMSKVQVVWLLGGEKIEIYDKNKRHSLKTFIYLPKFVHFLGVSEEAVGGTDEKEGENMEEGLEEDAFASEAFDIMPDPFDDVEMVEETEDEEEEELEGGPTHLGDNHLDLDGTNDKEEQTCTDEVYLDRFRSVQLGGVVVDTDRPVDENAPSTDAIIVPSQNDPNQPVESKESKQSIKGPVTRSQAKKYKKPQPNMPENLENQNNQGQLNQTKEQEGVTQPAQPLLSDQVANVQDLLLQIPKEWSEKQDKMRDLIQSNCVFNPGQIDVSFSNFPYHLSQNLKASIVELATLVLHHSQLSTSVPFELESISNRVLLQGPHGTHVYQELLVKALANEVGATLLVFDRKELRGEEVVLATGGSSKKTGGIHSSDLDTNSMSDSQLKALVRMLGDRGDAYGITSQAIQNLGCGISGQRPRKKARLMYPNKLESRSGDENRVKIGHCSPFIRDGDTVIFGVVGSNSASENSKKRENLIKGKLDAIQSIINQNFGTAMTAARKAGLGSVLGPSADSGLATTKSKAAPANTSKSNEDNQTNTKTGPKDGQMGRVMLRFPGPPQRLGVWFTESIPGGHNLVGNGNNSQAGSSEEGLVENGYYCEGGELRVLADDVDGNLFGALKEVVQALCSTKPVILFMKDIDVVLGKSQERLEFLKSFIKQLPPHILVLGGQVLPPEVRQKGGSSGVDHLSKMVDSEVNLFYSGLSGAGAFGSGSSALKDVGKTSNSQLRELLPNMFSIYAPVGEPEKSKWESDLQRDLADQREDRNKRNIAKLLKRCNIECTDLENISIREQVLDKEALGQVVGWALAHNVTIQSSTESTTQHEKVAKIQAVNIMAAVERIKNLQMEQAQVRSQLRDVQTEDSYEKKILGEVIPPEAVGVSFDDVGALERIKECLKEAVMLPLQRPELFKKSRLLQPPKGVLLFGPPGTGKTMLAKAVAKESGANFIHVSMSSIASKWFGDGEKYVRALFSLARKIMPCVIFVDEVDAMLGKRDRSSEHEAMRRIKNEFMQLWDGMRSMEGEQLLVLAATNRPMDLDEAVIRRLPRRLMVELPDKENRIKILQVILKGEDLQEGFNYQELAEIADGYSGSDMKNLCQAAAYRPLRELLKEEQSESKNGEEKVGAKRKSQSSGAGLRALGIEDFKMCAKEVGPSVNNNDFLMNELKQWNEMYGEGGSRAPPVLTYFI